MSEFASEFDLVRRNIFFEMVAKLTTAPEADTSARRDADPLL
jgi:hypothetical protein